MVEVGEALVLLADGRRGGSTQDVGEGAPGGAVFGQQPGLLALQEGRQGLPEGEEEGMNALSLSLSHSRSRLFYLIMQPEVRETKVNPRPSGRPAGLSPARLQTNRVVVPPH